MDKPHGSWRSISNLETRPFICGHCGKEVASQLGDKTGTSHHDLRGYLYVCPNCNRPTFFYRDEQVPGELLGKSIANLPENIADLYREAQRCISVGSYTACILVCRKLLMHISHDNGAKEGMGFFQYVNHLYEKHYIPLNGKEWVDYIREKSNEANHEIVIASKDDAVGLLGLTEMLLQIVYDMPNRIPKPPKPETT